MSTSDAPSVKSLEERFKDHVRFVDGQISVMHLALADKPEKDRWWQAFFKAAELLGSGLQNLQTGDRGAECCAQFADQAIAEAKTRGRL